MRENLEWMPTGSLDMFATKKIQVKCLLLMRIRCACDNLQLSASSSKFEQLNVARHSISAGICWLLAVEISPWVNLFYLKGLICDCKVLNQSTSPERPDQVTDKKKHRENKAAGFAGFCMDDSHVFSCAWEWVMVTVRKSDSPLPTWASSLLGLSDCCRWCLVINSVLSVR